ncbi:uncharacterized protein LACBIDRAFT_311401 [Laccaria bicolor S238N-H82]|uniref:Predicted protein n=1 Tax=Laccaria bicolor (strain S238N-H82 / ATCC MYA-4686) TaxID=486041 RepID=B0CZX5_LACBS|nr:uncharacterized protein LACBIDRAFT_311401 [Laccaria bicolor S238N-H82]EDR12227.1 predicted protein [Laccaria bicolor S238N-H82]|eukprot:XP_001876491.1 predicted protein [Laccaria bicolor S238N-H82]
MTEDVTMPTPNDDRDHVKELQEFVIHLSEQPGRESVASEIEVLQSIYGDTAIRLWQPPTRIEQSRNNQEAVVRYEVVLSLPSPNEDVSLTILVSLPSTYPATSSPQLQLLSRYIGPFGADSNLFGSILRTYISINGIEWSEDSLCVFDGLQNVLERCTAWYEERLSAEKAGELMRVDAKGNGYFNADSSLSSLTDDTSLGTNDEGGTELESDNPSPPTEIPAGIQIFVAEPITDRKSTFIGRACQISQPSDVPLVLAHLMSERRISRAAHPIINAWRCQVGSVLHQDNDDDGETAAGGRLAHLLQILDVNNVLVIVTRYFGGIHLGPDRFKHINQAARSALEGGGFLDALETRKNTGRGKKH